MIGMSLTINRERIISISSVVIFLIDVDNADFDVPAIVLCAKVLYDAQYIDPRINHRNEIQNVAFHYASLKVELG